MALNDHDQTRIRDYLLGHLSDLEQQELEERLMTEDDLFEELEISKGELLEEYSAHELAQKEHEWFEQHYLASAEGRQRHAFTLALDSIKRSTPVPQSSATWFDRLAVFLKRKPWAIAIATSSALVAIVAGLSIWSSTLVTPLRSYAFTLNSTLSQRSSGDARYPIVPLSPEIGELRITLQLPEGTMRGKDYGVTLDDRSEITNLRATAHDENSVLVVIPTASLHEGPYELRLKSIKDDNTEQAIPGEYRFQLVSPNRSSATPKP